MTSTRTLDVSGLPAYNVSNQSPVWWGQLLLCLIEGTMFCILIATYFYLRLGMDAWPPPGIPRPDTLTASLALIPLALSCVGSYWASEGAKRNSRRDMLLGLGSNLALALIFLAFRAWEWLHFTFTWASDAYGSVVWSILFLHSYDVIADLIMTTVLIVIVASGRYGEKQRIGVHVDSVVWYFLAAIWLPLYAVVYWGPLMVGVSR